VPWLLRISPWNSALTSMGGLQVCGRGGRSQTVFGMKLVRFGRGIQI
jgi:hypothetical protein